MSLIFRVGLENEKISRNPLSGLRRKHEDNDRVRYLSLEEETKLVDVLAQKYSEYLPHFTCRLRAECVCPSSSVQG